MSTEFEELVAENWSHAVRVGSHDFESWEARIVEALCSESEEVRSAAVAAINEANSTTHRDSILELCLDSSQLVRGEVLEYLGEFAELEDIPLILRMYELGSSAQEVTLALDRLIPDGPGIIDEEDDSKESASQKMSAWQSLALRYMHGAT